MKPWEVARPCVAVASAEVEQRDVYCRLEVPRGAASGRRHQSRLVGLRPPEVYCRPEVPRGAATGRMNW
jgi:hypothetical protein